jgi:hypothetical protein
VTRTLAAALLIVGLAGCNGDWFHEPRPRSLEVENQTDRDLRLYYVRRDGTEFPDIGVAPHRTASFTMAFGMESSSCASGTLLARDGSTIVSSIERPCAGSTWTIPAIRPSAARHVRGDGVVMGP